jgi:hypothetical protein
MRFNLTVKQETNKWHSMQSSKSDVARSTGAQGAQYSQWPRLVEIMINLKKGRSWIGIYNIQFHILKFSERTKYFLI